jgi:hypothetical protein
MKRRSSGCSTTSATARDQREERPVPQVGEPEADAAQHSVDERDDELPAHHASQPLVDATHEGVEPVSAFRAGHRAQEIEDPVARDQRVRRDHQHDEEAEHPSDDLRDQRLHLAHRRADVVLRFAERALQRLVEHLPEVGAAPTRLGDLDAPLPLVARDADAVAREVHVVAAITARRHADVLDLIGGQLRGRLGGLLARLRTRQGSGTREEVLHPRDPLLPQGLDRTRRLAQEPLGLGGDPRRSDGHAGRQAAEQRDVQDDDRHPLRKTPTAERDAREPVGGGGEDVREDHAEGERRQHLAEDRQDEDQRSSRDGEEDRAPAPGARRAERKGARSFEGRIHTRPLPRPTVRDEGRREPRRTRFLGAGNGEAGTS